MALEIRKLLGFFQTCFLRGKKAKRDEARVTMQESTWLPELLVAHMQVPNCNKCFHSSEFWVLSKENVMSWRASFLYM